MGSSKPIDALINRTVLDNSLRDATLRFALTHSCAATFSLVRPTDISAASASMPSSKVLPLKYLLAGLLGFIAASAPTRTLSLALLADRLTCASGVA